MFRNRTMLTLIILVVLTIVFTNAGLTTVFEWQQLEFDYKDEAARSAAIADGSFVEGQSVPIDVDIDYLSSGKKHRIFITIPRRVQGIPVTVGTVTDKKINGNPVIVPYPNWSWQKTDCKGMVSVFRVKIDECGRLWILDSGNIGSNQICPAQLLLFDLNTNKLLHRTEIPSNLYTNSSNFVTPIIEVLDKKDLCENTFVYIANSFSFVLIVFDLKNNHLYNIFDDTFKPDPNFGTYTIEGDTFELLDGILGMELSPLKKDENRKLHYHAMSSNTEHWAWTSDLKNSSLFENDGRSSPQVFHTYDGTRTSQSAAMAVDKNGVMFFGNMADTTVMCWNTAKPYGGNNLHVVEKNRITLQFPSGVKVITHRRKQELWILTSAFQKVMTGNLSLTEPNFRILTENTEDLLKGTGCV